MKSANVQFGWMKSGKAGIARNERIVRERKGIEAGLAAIDRRGEVGHGALGLRGETRCEKECQRLNQQHAGKDAESSSRHGSRRESHRAGQQDLSLPSRSE